jgi:hypothetical protein
MNLFQTATNELFTIYFSQHCLYGSGHFSMNETSFHLGKGKTNFNQEFYWSKFVQHEMNVFFIDLIMNDVILNIS